MSKLSGVLLMVLCLSLFGGPVANAIASSTEPTIAVDGDGKKKHKRKKHKKHGKKHKKHGKKQDEKKEDKK
jgi:hypothetical protein